LSNMWENTSLFTPKECDFTIVKLPATRDAVNQKWLQHHLPGKKITNIRVKNKDLKIWIGQPLIAYNNSKKEGIINSMSYVVKDISPDIVELENTELKKSIFVSHKAIGSTMRYGWADTIMRIISRSIPQKFNIDDVDKMSWNELYVAMSRATCKKDIGFSYDLVAGKKFEFHSPPKKGQVIKQDLKKTNPGYIYRITDGDVEYIGSTMKPLEVRLQQHFDKPTSKMMGKWLSEKEEKIRIELIDEALVYEEKQLTKLEYMWIAKMDPAKSMNTKGRHSMSVAVKETSTKYNKTIEVDYSRFKIRDDENSKRYDIAYRDENGKFVRKRFSYAKKSKENALKEAEVHRAELIKRYFM